MDIFDPETWKPFAALAEYWKSIVSGAVVIAGGLATFAKWGVGPNWLVGRQGR